LNSYSCTKLPLQEIIGKDHIAEGKKKSSQHHLLPIPSYANKRDTERDSPCGRKKELSHGFRLKTQDQAHSGEIQCQAEHPQPLSYALNIWNHVRQVTKALPPSPNLEQQMEEQDSVPTLEQKSLKVSTRLCTRVAASILATLRLSTMKKPNAPTPTPELAN
jgi:hypothetical protein